MESTQPRSVVVRDAAAGALPKHLTGLLAVLHDPALMVSASERTILDVNPACERLMGRTRGELVGRSAAVLHVDTASFRDLGAKLAEAARGRESFSIDWPLARSCGDRSERFLARLSIAPALDLDGSLVGFVGTVLDLTSVQAAQARTKLLAEASQVLARQSLEPDAILRSLAALATRTLADYCSVDVFDEQGVLQRVEVAHADPSRDRELHAYQARYPPDPAYASYLRSLSSPTARLHNDLSPEALRAFLRDDDHVRAIQGLGLRHSLTVPLMGRSGIIGALGFSRSREERFTAEDQKLATELCERAAIAYENARLHRAATAAEARLRNIFENAPVQILTTDRAGRITTINQSLFGRPVSRIIGTSVYDTVPQNERARVHPLIFRALEEGVPADYEVKLDVGHETVWRQVRIAPTREGGEITGAVILSTDVTKRKEAEAALQESEARFRALVTASTHMIWRTDGAGMIVDMPEWRDFTGQSVEEVRGAGWLDAIHPEDRARVRSTWLAAFEARTIYECEYRVRSRSGEYRWFLARGVPRFDAQGTLIEYIGTWTDITKQREATMETDALRTQLVQSEKLAALGSLVSGVAHEIRTPLTYLANNLFLVENATRKLVRSSAGSATQHELASLEARIADAHDSVERINRIVEDLRRYTRMPPKQETTPMSLHAAVRDAVDLFRATHRGQAIVEDELDPTREIHVDRVQMQQVVLNLLQNAGEARSNDGIIRVRTYNADDGGVVLEIADHGEGIPPAILQRIWDPFFTTKSEGTGLGLSIVKRIVDHHQAQITCQSAVGQGTTFRIRFPSAT